MEILIVGGGGREHALAWKLSQNSKITKLYCAPGNAGIEEFAECIQVSATDIDGQVELAKRLNVDMVFVAPDDPLVLGLVDELEKNGIRAFGPRKDAARLEGSKAFSKDLMKKYNIPTAFYEVFDNYEKANEYLANSAYPIVVKADGLALGKGVYICENYKEAKIAIGEIMLDKKFGSSGSQVVIEEFLVGEEISILSFCDGDTVVPMVSSKDHKKAFDKDKGPNTGGMGTISPVSVYTDELDKRCMEELYIPTVQALKSEGITFKGIIYFGLILTKYGPKVLEYNARFGDPEAQVVLPRLKTDLVQIIDACIDGTLDKVNIQWYDNAAICVIMASGGYPASYQKGYEITGLEDVSDNTVVFHSGTAKKDGKTVTNGGRVLGVTSIGKDLEEATKIVYEEIKKIDFKDSFYRNDIWK